MKSMDSETNPTKPVGDPENLRRLREQAMARLEREERERAPAPIYGGPPLGPRPPAPVYGGPPVPAPKKGRWVLPAIGIGLAAIDWFMAKFGIWPLGPPAPVYGGPPMPRPGLLLLGQWINRFRG